MSFNLVHDPWISVVRSDGTCQEVSLIDFFTQWQNLHDIQAENPPTKFSMFRFLQAILNHVYQGPHNVNEWEDIQEDNGKKVIAYLEKNHDRFDLFHLEYPFMQDPDILEEDAGEVYLASVLHGNNTSTVFCHEHQWSNVTIPIAESARLLLRLQNFDTGGRKTGATDSAAVMPLMDAANVLVRGDNLRETLLFNLMKYIPATTGEDLPSWERKLKKPQERVPGGLVDYLTFSWRRVRLFTQNSRVVKIALHPGDKLPKSVSASQWECAVAYRRSSKGDLLTVRLNSKRSLWRDSAVFLQSSDEGSSRPRIIDWITDLKFAGLITKNLPLQVLGLNVDNAKPLGWSEQRLSAPDDYLHNKMLWQALSQALDIAEKHQEIFRAFAGSPYSSLAQALKNNDVGKLAASLDGESRYWVALDRIFQEFLNGLVSDENTIEGVGTTYGSTKLPEWLKAVQKSAREAFTDSIASISNYQARAMALKTLSEKLFYLRESPEDKAGRKAKSSTKKKQKNSKQELSNDDEIK
jgi:CRISPR system Cascade subunit CasA